MASPGWEIRSTWSVAESDSSFEDFVLIHDIRNSSETGAFDKRLRLLPGPEKQSCEVTVKFLQQQHAIHSIDVLSTARTCEAYRLTDSDTDAEYLCTARGQLEEEEGSKPLYRAEMEMEDPDHCTSVTIRLLSVQDKSQVIIGHILILVSPGPYLAGGASGPPPPAPPAPSLGAFAPLMLQMAQGFSNGPQSQQSGLQELAMRALSLKQPELPQPSKSSEASLEDVCQRLERLESVCARIETSLSKTLEAFDKRLQLLESTSPGT